MSISLLQILHNNYEVIIMHWAEELAKRIYEMQSEQSFAVASLKSQLEEVEKKLKRKFKRENWTQRHHQMVLFGRYHCMARNPNCESCKLKDFCKYNKRKEN